MTMLPRYSEGEFPASKLQGTAWLMSVGLKSLTLQETVAAFKMLLKNGLLGPPLFGRLLFGMGQNHARSCAPKIMIWICLCKYFHCDPVSLIATRSERQRVWKTVSQDSFAENQTSMREKHTSILVFGILQ